MPPPHAAASFPAPKSPMSQRRDDNMQRTLGLRAALALSLSYPSVPRFAREHRGAQAMATRRGPGLHSVRCRRLRAPAARRPEWPWSPSEGPARGPHSPLSDRACPFRAPRPPPRPVSLTVRRRVSRPRGPVSGERVGVRWRVRPVSLL